MKKISFLFVVSVLLVLTSCGGMKAGTYTKTVSGMHAPITVEITVDKDNILDAVVVDHAETPGVGDIAAERVASEIVQYQSLDVDTVSGATITSAIVRAAFTSCLEEAGADMKALTSKRERTSTINDEYTSDVVIVGGGGAGITAAIFALEQGATVTLIEKTDLFGGNSILVGGFMNSVVPELQDYFLPERSLAMESLITDALAETPVSQKHAELQAAVQADFDAYLASNKTMFDSENWHALQTWNGGDKVGDIDFAEILGHGAPVMQKWLIDNGMVFRDEVFIGGGAMYTRSRYPDRSFPNGTGYLNTLTEMLYKYGEDQLTVLMRVEGESLITEGDKVVGVIARDVRGNKDVTLNANKGVILATGGFAGNVELRVKYAQGEKWPDLGPSLKTTNTGSITGDGIFMAEEVGANLVNMDQIQVLHVTNPQSGILNDASTEYDGRVFINKEGKRFVREDGRRDEMALAILDQTDSMTYIFGSTPKPLDETLSMGGQPVSYFVDNNIAGFIADDTLEGIAEKMGVPVDVLQETIETFNDHVASGAKDEFGRVSYTVPINMNGPFLAYPRVPGAHHTMGGVEIDEETRVLNKDGEPIDGLYAAGEITGVIHGSNRIGGNAIVDYLVFGRIAGLNAAMDK